jgi:hypothetical protein
MHEPLNLVIPNNMRETERRRASAFVQPHNLACWPTGYYTPISPPLPESLPRQPVAAHRAGRPENLPRQPVAAHRAGRQRAVCSVRPSRRHPGPTPSAGRWRPVPANNPRLNNRWLRRRVQQDGSIIPEFWGEGEGDL